MEPQLVTLGTCSLFMLSAVLGYVFIYLKRGGNFLDRFFILKKMERYEIDWNLHIGMLWKCLSISALFAIIANYFDGITEFLGKLFLGGAMALLIGGVISIGLIFYSFWDYYSWLRDKSQEQLIVANKQKTKSLHR